MDGVDADDALRAVEQRVQISAGSRTRSPDRGCRIARRIEPLSDLADLISTPASGSSLGKYNFPNTSPAAVPYGKKSYHSIVDAMTASRRLALWSDSASARYVVAVHIRMEGR
jgi:hypothetical protein